MQPSPQERELVVRAQQGDKEAVGILYETYAQVVFRYISYRVESDVIAEDLTSDVFLRMVRSLPEYKDIGAPFGAWLFRIAANRITDFYRGRQTRQAEAIPETYSIDTDLTDRLEDEEERGRLREALRALPEEYQTVLILRFMQDKPHADIAVVVGKSVEAVRVVQHRALKALATQLKAMDARQQERGKH
jgi:RNA polymerase sigma-70 factor (ECF subfamily)